jgi:methylase of polypeptide subunit release factors
MTATTRDDPPAVDRPDDVRRIRDTLDRAGFDDRHILERMGALESADLSFSAMDRPRVLRRTRQGDPLATFIRVFLADAAIPLDDFRRAVEPMDPATWAELGLVEADGDLVRRRVALRPVQGLVIAHDGALPDGGTRSDHVLGVSGSTHTFARSMMRIPAERTLDLGTGGGYLAMLAAAHSRQVLGTDVNARAIAMARFNAQLNGIGNIELAAGDLYEPAGERRFDLILSNPPFVVSPEGGVKFRDSGLLGDEICERIIRGAPAHLAEGGFAQVMCNWVRPADRDWVERLTGWFEDSGCDVWVIQALSFDPADYAQHWLGQGDAPVKARFAEHFDRWMDYYDRQGIEAIDFGLINLRRRSTERNWVQFDVDRRHNQPNGTGIHVGFAALDLVRRIEDVPSWLSLRLRCRPELRLSQRLEPGASGWKVEKAECVLGDGLRFEGEVDPIVFHLLTLCRGREPLSEILPQVAARVGGDPEEVMPAGLRAARELVEQGFLWPVDLPLEPPGLTRPVTGIGDGHASG